MRNPKSVTGRFLSGKERIEVPAERRKPNGRTLVIKGAKEHNLKDLTVELPLNVFTCVTGVSGSGKSTLINDILYQALARKLSGAAGPVGKHDGLSGLEHVDKVIIIDQSPIGRTPRSNPATYTGVFNPIRDLFAQTKDAKLRGYQPGRFSFNVRGGRCEKCGGAGLVKIEMHFLPDIFIPCEQCKGLRFNRETLEVRFKDRNISEVLEMTVEEALEFFKNQPQVARKLQTIYDVGLGYIRLGQPATTLSGGEAQRVKLSTELGRRATGKTLYLLDEPTTGLHFADIKKLLDVLHRLVAAGNTVLVIEHNMDVIKTADHIIDLGPEGGDEGGYLVAKGTPEAVARTDTATGRILKKVLKKHRR
jgi:excinuclease ABC subunit A